jgi:hypothetical protein
MYICITVALRIEVSYKGFGESEGRIIISMKESLLMDASS